MCNLSAVWELYGYHGHQPFSGVSLEQTGPRSDVCWKILVPFFSPVGFEQIKRVAFDLINIVRTVYCAGTVRVLKDYASLLELVDCETSDRFPTIRRIFLTVMFGKEGHHGGYPHQGIGCGRPGCARFQIKQTKQSEGRPFVLLRGWQPYARRIDVASATFLLTPTGFLLKSCAISEIAIQSLHPLSFDLENHLRFHRPVLQVRGDLDTGCFANRMH